MGRSTTPKYAVQMTGHHGYGTTPFGWKGRLPKVADLEKFVMAMVVSTYPGFVNEHIGNQFGISMPSKAIIRENVSGGRGRIMVEWNAPTFMVLPDAADYPAVAKAYTK